MNANYILKQKYVFGAYFSRTQDQFMQTAYQSTERLAMIYKMMNWNYTQYVGLMATVPFQVGTWWDSRWVAVEQYARHRCDDFFDLPFDRKKWILQCQWDNTFKLNKNLAFELRGFMQTPAIQGTYRPENGGYGRCRGEMDRLPEAKPHSLPVVATYSIQVCRNVTYVTEVRT